MKMTKIAKFMMVGCAVLALAACSSTKHNAGGYDATGMNDMNTAADGAKASGLGEGQRYGDENGAGSAQGLAKRT